jgi:hypothetical protein
MREPKEVERLRLAETQRTPARDSAPTKLDQPRLVGMKRQSKARKPHFEIGKELLRLMLVLKADDAVVRVTHDDHVAGGAVSAPPVGPQIVDVVEIDVRQERADNSPLWRPLLGHDQPTMFEYTCLKPLGDQPDDPSIADPMFDEPDQPILANLVEKGLNVAIKHPVDLPLPNSERERVQRLMLVTPEPEPVTEAEKLRFIDRCQDCKHCRLDDLVLQSGDAERPLSAIRLRYVRPARWQRSIRSCVHTSVKICEVGLDVLHVVGPRHLVDTRRSGPLQVEEARPQNIDADVMQERRQLALSVPGDGISYAGLRI